MDNRTNTSPKLANPIATNCSTSNSNSDQSGSKSSTHASHSPSDKTKPPSLSNFNNFSRSKHLPRPPMSSKNNNKPPPLIQIGKAPAQRQISNGSEGSNLEAENVKFLVVEKNLSKISQSVVRNSFYDLKFRIK